LPAIGAKNRRYNRRDSRYFAAVLPSAGEEYLVPLLVDNPPEQEQNRSMSVVEDVRQVLQDFLAPELRALAVKIDAVDQKVDSLEAKMNAKFETVEAKLQTINHRIDALEETTQIRFERAEEKAAARQEMLLIQFDSMRHQLNLDGRLRRIEDRETSQALAQSV
jgi:hypothetical protein